MENGDSRMVDVAPESVTAGQVRLPPSPLSAELPRERGSGEHGTDSSAWNSRVRTNLRSRRFERNEKPRCADRDQESEAWPNGHAERSNSRDQESEAGWA